MAKEINLTKGQVAIVCECHAHLVEGDKWFAVWDPKLQSFYARRHSSRLLGKQKTISMHRVINNTPNGLQTDHINGNTLDNRCCNLRVATVSQNQMNQRKRLDNTSGYKGVTQRKDCCKWAAQIQFGGKRVYLGLFDTPEDAACAYNDASRKFYGEFARTK